MGSVGSTDASVFSSRRAAARESGRAGQPGERPTQRVAGAGEEYLVESVRRLDAWLRRAEWKGYDTFDGLSSPAARLLTCDNHYLRIVWQQSVRRFPVNLRPLLRVPPAKSSKAMGFLAQGYLRLHQLYGRQEDLDNALMCLEWLVEHPSPGYSGLAWGNHFSYESRAGTIPRGTPTIVWTSLIGMAFLDAYDLLGGSKYLEVAESICRFLLTDIHTTEFAESHCFAYTPGGGGLVHNANMLAAAFLSRSHSALGDAALLEHARRAVQFTVDHQLENGGWLYAEGGKWNWIDSFHSAYVLESLHTYALCSGDSQWDDSLQRGYEFYVNRFFGDDGTPFYYHDKARPLDIQCASQGIQTLVNLRSLDEGSLQLATRVARWTIDNMQDSRGFFYYRKYRLITNRTPTLHWGQSTMLAALAVLLTALHSTNR